MIDVLKQSAVDGGKVSKSYVPETCPALADLTSIEASQPGTN